jgi:endo-1,4-beta-xylanase
MRTSLTHRSTLVRAAATLAVVPLLTGALAGPPHGSRDTYPSHRPPGVERIHKPDTLRGNAPRGFRIGTAVAGGGHHEEQDYPDPFPNDAEYRYVLAQEFNSVSPENQMKWEFIHPEQGEYNFEPADSIVRFAQRNRQAVRGHTLLWHSQNPEWLEEGDFTPEELRAILEDHITTVVGRYRGKIQQWDVANEIFDEDGEYRTENIFIRELGPEIVLDAFRWAHEADPRAKLFLNDYGVESLNAKSDAYYELVQQMQAADVPVHGFSVQGHLSLSYDFPYELQENLQRFDDLGVETAVTEIDVRMELPEDGEPTFAQQARQAHYYDQALEACLAVEDCNSFTVWGFTDTYSWVPVFFEGQGSATIMTGDFERKPAYFELRESLRDERAAWRRHS